MVPEVSLLLVDGRVTPDELIPARPARQPSDSKHDGFRGSMHPEMPRKPSKSGPIPQQHKASGHSRHAMASKSNGGSHAVAKTPFSSTGNYGQIDPVILQAPHRPVLPHPSQLPWQQNARFQSPEWQASDHDARIRPGPPQGFTQRPGVPPQAPRLYTGQVSGSGYPAQQYQGGPPPVSGMTGFGVLADTQRLQMTYPASAGGYLPYMARPQYFPMAPSQHQQQHYQTQPLPEHSLQQTRAPQIMQYPPSMGSRGVAHSEEHNEYNLTQSFPSPIQAQPEQDVEKTPKPARDSDPHSPKQSPGNQSGSTDSGMQSNDSADSAHLDHTATSLTQTVGDAPEHVYQLLRSQDEQLKLLREQVQQLLAKQNGGNSHETGASAASDADVEDTVPMARSIAVQQGNSLAGTPTKVPQRMEHQTEKKCSVAVNTSLWWPEKQQLQLANSADDMTQQRTQAAQIENSRDFDSDAALNPMMAEWVQAQPTESHNPSLPYEHDANPLESSVTAEAMEPKTAEAQTLYNDTLSLGEFQLTKLHDRTEESLVSDLVVDMPAYGSLSPEKLVTTNNGINIVQSSDIKKSIILSNAVVMSQNIIYARYY